MPINLSYGNEFIYGKRILDMMSWRHIIKRSALVSIALVALFVASVIEADGDPTVSKTLENELADKFSPCLYFHPDEAFYPISPNYTIARSNLNSTSGLLHQNVTSEMLATYNSTSTEYYLDNRMGTLFDDGIENDFLQCNASYPPMVYTRVVSGNFKGQAVFLTQYWLFYPFNKGPVNTHEGDWEMMMVIADSDSNPIAAVYSQHLTGQALAWDEVEKNGMHPKVCVALGSHANYFNASSGDTGIIFDEKSNVSNVLTPDEYRLVPLGELDDHSSETDWLEFSGYWGAYGSETSAALGQRGSRGPAYQSDGKWSDPGKWAESLEQLEESPMKMIVLASIVVILVILSILAYRKCQSD